MLRTFAVVCKKRTTRKPCKNWAKPQLQDFCNEELLGGNKILRKKILIFNVIFHSLFYVVVRRINLRV